MAKMKDFTQGNPGKQLLAFSWPLIIEILLQNFYNSADTMVVGKFLGDVAMGAVGCAGTITNVVLMLVTGMTQGAAVVISQYVGAVQETNVKKTLMTSTYIIIALAVVFGIVGLCASSALLDFINVEGEAKVLASQYLRIMFAGTVATALYNMGYVISRSLGDSLSPMIILIFTSVLNIGLNVLFVAGFHMGVAGVAYATVLATVIAAVICWVIIWKRCPMIRPDRTSLKPDREIGKIIFKLGIPSALSSSTGTLGVMAVQSMVNSFTTGSLPVMAAYAAATKIEALVTYPMGGISHGIQVLVGQNVGAGKFERVGQGLKASVKIIAVYSLLCGALLLFGGRTLMSLFTATEATVGIGYKYLVIIAVFVFFNGVSFTLRAVLNGAGDSVASAVFTVVELAARIAGAYILSGYTPLGYIGVFLGTPIGWVITSGAATARFCGGKWKQKRIVKSSSVRTAQES